MFTNNSLLEPSFLRLNFLHCSEIWLRKCKTSPISFSEFPMEEYQPSEREINQTLAFAGNGIIIYS